MKTNSNLPQKYRIKVQNKFEALEGKQEIEELGNNLKIQLQKPLKKKSLKRKGKQNKNG